MNQGEGANRASADRFLNDAVRGLMNGVLNPRVDKQGFFITCNIRSLDDPLNGISGSFAYCVRETLECIKAMAPSKVTHINKLALDRGKFPEPVEFKCSTGKDHVIIWFERVKTAD